MTRPDDGPGSSDDGAVRRWRGYLDATVVVELDGSPLDLTGPEATSDWPFAGPVHALTAWDPAGQTRSRADNDAHNDLLRRELDATGARVRDAAGYRGSHITGELLDRGFVVSDLPEERVREIAASFGQEAIYRISAAELTVIAAADGTEESRPRC